MTAGEPLQLLHNCNYNGVAAEEVGAEILAELTSEGHAADDAGERPGEAEERETHQSLRNGKAEF